jgi:hypothetical protein
MGTSKPWALVPLFDLKFLGESAACIQELQIGGTSRNLVKRECQIQNSTRILNLLVVF